MSKESISSNYYDVGFFEILTVLFIGLKLTGYIDWSWWLVLCPLIIPIIIIIILMVIVLFLRG